MSKKTLATMIALWVCTITLTVIFTSIYAAVNYNQFEINAFATIILPAIVSAVSTAIPVYIGVIIGVPKEIDNAIDTVEKKIRKSPTVQRAMKFMELSDKLFGDDQAVAQMTGFFREARELVGSPEAKNFFSNASKALSEFTKTSDSPEKEEDLIRLPKKPKS